MSHKINWWQISTIALFIIAVIMGIVILHMSNNNSGNFRVNERGQTYNVGPIDLSDPDIVAPDLMSVVGVNEKKGYVYRTDYMETRHPSEIQSFEEYEEWLQKKSSSIEIPVYECDGVTEIDTYIIGSES